MRSRFPFLYAIALSFPLCDRALVDAIALSFPLCDRANPAAKPQDQISLTGGALRCGLSKHWLRG
ncbi:hypothetical protein [Moorena sp. SIOASIH]|uniref:hypothetical protein n=1 Tax=Moorena sp. SIOASIH TaxID=2607817 RepID=UPI0025F6F723|nr:hypothetical protein [Moorena sp. SIOASIH]